MKKIARKIVADGKFGPAIQKQALALLKQTGQDLEEGLLSSLMSEEAKDIMKEQGFNSWLDKFSLLKK